MAFPTTALLDDFNRADGGAGANWNTTAWGDPGSINIASNQAKSSSTFTTALWMTSFGPDAEVYFTMPTLEGLSVSVRLLLRWSSTSSGTPNGYSLRVQDHGTTWTIYKVTSGTESSLGTITAAATTAGDSLGFSCVGSTLEGWYKSGAGAWVSKGSVSDATYGAAGFVGLEFPDTTLRIDDFSGGTISGGAGPTTIPDLVARRR